MKDRHFYVEGYNKHTKRYNNMFFTTTWASKVLHGGPIENLMTTSEKDL